MKTTCHLLINLGLIIIASQLLFFCGKSNREIITGAERTEMYLPFLEGKKIALVANHTSKIKDTHLLDSLLSLEIGVTKVFTPEHGFRGTADAGEQLSDYTDQETGIQVISLYGEKKKPSPDDLSGIDLVMFDIQDVGARFYTYISTLHYVMEACAENNVDFLVLDRPNPNGFYVDGPVLDTACRSFVGMHPVPVVHGMTVAEYARMINGERWLKDSLTCNLKYVKCENYDHNKAYELPIKPSPNLPNLRSVYLYPSLCFFEGTCMSVGRGTDFPFQVFGHPAYVNETFSFTPGSNEGASNPKYSGIECKGVDLRDIEYRFFWQERRIILDWLIDAYNNMKENGDFFNSYFSKLSGTQELQKQIESGKSPEDIYKTWEADLIQYKQIRKKYLLYPDFE